MNLLHIVLYAIAVLALLLLGMYLGYLLTRYTLFNKIMEPAIRDAFSRGEKKGFELGRDEVRRQAMKVLALDLSLLDVPDDEIARLQDNAPLAHIDWTEGEEE